MNSRTAYRLVPVIVSLAVALATPGRAADDATQTRALSSFQSIRLEGAFTTDIVAGGDRSQIVVRGEREAVDRVVSEVRDGTLVVRMRSGSDSFKSFPKLVITLPTFRSFKNEGAGTVKIAGLTGGDFEIGNAGAGIITATGRAARLTIALDGTGKIDTTAVDARDVTVDNNGVGGVYVRASGSLTANVNGIGEIRYAGKPSHIASHIDRIGRIKAL